MSRWTAYAPAAGITCGHLHDRRHEARDCAASQPHSDEWHTVALTLEADGNRFAAAVAHVKLAAYGGFLAGAVNTAAASVLSIFGHTETYDYLMWSLVATVSSGILVAFFADLRD